MFIKPAPVGPHLPGTILRVIDPDTGHPLPETGLDVPETPYWLRRLTDGDVVPEAAAPNSVGANSLLDDIAPTNTAVSARRKSSASSAE